MNSPSPRINTPSEQLGVARTCSRCIMDTTDPDITFDSTGICSHCHRYDELARSRLLQGEAAEQRLAALLARVKTDGQGKAYDCVIGVSGGVDSTYLAYLVKRFGLRPLAVHLDNGWDSELAVKNIERTLKALGIDLYTYVIDWEEFRDLQLAFLQASTPDAEVPTDHAILATLYRAAAAHGLRDILLGTNVATEAILPLKWGYGYFDRRYIRSVHQKFGQRRLQTYPYLSLPRFAYYTFWKNIRIVPILNYVRYDKHEAMNTIQSQLGWVYYGGKHYESIYTRFFQAYILPRKFNIDKRKAHYSNLVCSGQWSRARALAEMENDDYARTLERDDKAYVVKKLGLSLAEFDRLMALPTKTFMAYPNLQWLFKLAHGLRRRVLVT